MVLGGPFPPSSFEPGDPGSSSFICGSPRSSLIGRAGVLELKFRYHHGSKTRPARLNLQLQSQLQQRAPRPSPTLRDACPQPGLCVSRPSPSLGFSPPPFSRLSSQLARAWTFTSAERIVAHLHHQGAQSLYASTADVAALAGPIWGAAAGPSSFTVAGLCELWPTSSSSALSSLSRTSCFLHVWSRATCLGFSWQIRECREHAHVDIGHVGRTSNCFA